METVAIVAIVTACLAAVAVLALAIRSCYLVKRLHQLVDSLSRSVEEELNPAVRSWREAADGVKHAAGKLDSGAASLASTLDRLDHFTEKLEPDSLLRTMMGPAILKLASWVAGFRKGMASVHAGKTEGRSDR